MSSSSREYNVSTAFTKSSGLMGPMMAGIVFFMAALASYFRSVLPFEDGVSCAAYSYRACTDGEGSARSPGLLSPRNELK